MAQVPGYVPTDNDLQRRMTSTNSAPPNEAQYSNASSSDVGQASLKATSHRRFVLTDPVAFRFDLQVYAIMLY